MKSLFRFFFKVFNRVKRIQRYEMDWVRLNDMLKQKETVANIILWDGRYKYTDFETMLKIIKYDIVKWHQYRLEEYDCDNFAMTFAGLVPFMYGVNNVGIAIGRVVDKDGNIGYHAWNVFLVQKSNGEPELYMYEPQSGKFTTYKNGRIGNWRYEPVIVIWG